MLRAVLLPGLHRFCLSVCSDAEIRNRIVNALQPPVLGSLRCFSCFKRPVNRRGPSHQMGQVGLRRGERVGRSCLWNELDLGGATRLWLPLQSPFWSQR